MFHQLETPVGGSLPLSFLVATIPIAVVLVLLGVMRRPAWQASTAGLIVGLVLAIGVWKLPAQIGISSVLAGATFAAWPIMWIVLNALLLYNVSVVSGRFDAFRAWMLKHLPNDRRVVLVVIGFSFGCLLEGVSGFGAPIAITSALLIALGFNVADALVFTLIFNTAPVLSVRPPDRVSVPAPLLPGAIAPPLATVAARATVPVPASAPPLLTANVPEPLSAPVTLSVPPLIVVVPV